jgi:hypothetical protein
MGATLSVACVGVFVSTHILVDSVAQAEAGYGDVIRCLLFECVGFCIQWRMQN